MPLTPDTEAGRQALRSITARPGGALVAFDYDGTLSPIVPDPDQAVAHPDALDAIRTLAERVGTVAIITGRPARVAVALSGLEELAGGGSYRIVVLGHYGLERWDAATGRFSSPEAPPQLDDVRSALPDVLAATGVEDAEVEDKGLSVAVHVRRSSDPRSAYAAVHRPLTELAERHGLVTEPGRFVLEIRPAGMDKGQALSKLLDELAATSVAFAGDDLGDLAAFDEVERRRRNGMPGLLVSSASEEVAELSGRADLVVDGAAGVVAFIQELIRGIGPTTS